MDRDLQSQLKSLFPETSFSDDGKFAIVTTDDVSERDFRRISEEAGAQKLAEIIIEEKSELAVTLSTKLRKHILSKHKELHEFAKEILEEVRGEPYEDEFAQFVRLVTGHSAKSLAGYVILAEQKMAQFASISPIPPEPRKIYNRFQLWLYPQLEDKRY